jgi:hypothetical protein
LGFSGAPKLGCVGGGDVLAAARPSAAERSNWLGAKTRVLTLGIAAISCLIIVRIIVRIIVWISSLSLFRGTIFKVGRCSPQKVSPCVILCPIKNL